MNNDDDNLKNCMWRRPYWHMYIWYHDLNWPIGLACSKVCSTCTAHAFYTHTPG